MPIDTATNPIKSLSKQPFFYLIIGIVLFLSYLVLRPFISAIVLAFLTGLFFKPVFGWFLKQFNGHVKLASLMTVIIVMGVVLVPLVSLSGLTIGQVIQFKNDFGSADSINLENIVSKANRLIEAIPGSQEPLTIDGATHWIQNGARAVGSFFLERLPDIGSGAFNSLTWVIVFMILLYSFFPLQDHFLRFIERISPLDDRLDRVYITRVIAMSKSMVKGTFLIAAVQGIISGIFLAIVGVPYVLFWTLLMIFLGVIPVMGYGIVLIPIAIVLLLTGGIWQGLLLIAASIVFIGNIDNFLRPKLVSKKAELHPALVILGVIGGLQVFGVLGFIYGPVIMILLMTTIEMYLKYVQRDRQADL
ncbi:MAG: AI-2E family transporter [Patescibacteria group bacterium]|nr:AI-2E family transporter [Patescibacteria group bacterium]MDD5716002.1 AI-2E family transporter [Patescibacteria group bacterium]